MGKYTYTRYKMIIIAEILSALGKKLSTYADEGATELNVQKVGAVINGWHDKDKDGIPNKPNGHSDRWTKFQAVARILGVIK